MYNYNHLFYFYITARTGGVTSAAKHLRLSQPSLSCQLKILEQVLDVKLFNKVGRRNELSESGVGLYDLCCKMFNYSAEIKKLVSKIKPSVANRLQIGISDEVDKSFVVEVVSNFLKQQDPKSPPQVTMVTGTREQLTERLRFKELDLLVSELAVIDPELNKIAYAEIPVVLTCSSKLDTSSLEKNEINYNPTETVQFIANQKNTRWIMPSGRLKLKNEIDNFFESNAIKSQVSLVTDSSSSIVRAVKDELGFAFLPLQYISQELHEKSIKIVGPRSGHWKYRVWLVCQHHNREDELIKSLAKSFNQICHV
jgi:LysR family transcriptional activator of nhaA